MVEVVLVADLEEAQVEVSEVVDSAADLVAEVLVVVALEVVGDFYGFTIKIRL